MTRVSNVHEHREARQRQDPNQEKYDLAAGEAEPILARPPAHGGKSGRQQARSGPNCQVTNALKNSACGAPNQVDVTEDWSDRYIALVRKKVTRPPVETATGTSHARTAPASTPAAAQRFRHEGSPWNTDHSHSGNKSGPNSGRMPAPIPSAVALQ